MRSIAIVIGDVGREDRTQLCLIEWDDVVQALAAQRADHPLGDGVGNRIQLHAMGTVVDDFASFTPTTR